MDVKRRSVLAAGAAGAAGLAATLGGVTDARAATVPGSETRAAHLRSGAGPSPPRLAPGMRMRRSRRSPI